MDDEREPPGRRAQRSGEVFGLLTRMVHRTGQDAAAILRREALTPAQWQLLRAVHDDPGGTQAELGRRFGTTGGNVSMLVAKLESSGHLHREPRGAANGIWLTSAGEQVVSRLEPEQQDFMARRFAVLDDDDLHTLHRLMSDLMTDLPNHR